MKGMKLRQEIHIGTGEKKVVNAQYEKTNRKVDDMKEKLIKELCELWDFIKSFLIISGVLFWLYIILLKTQN
jgi:hypothetical protein